MKLGAFILILFLLLGCKKDGHELGAIYDSIIGTWERQVGDDKSKIVVKPNGQMIFSRSIDRAGNIKVVALNFDESLSYPNWSTYYILTKNNKNPFLRIQVNDATDSMYTSAFSSIIDHTTTYNRHAFIKTK